MQFAATTAIAALSLLIVSVCQASDYPCGLANGYVLDVKSWAAEAKPDGKMEISITVGLKDLQHFRLPKAEKVAKLAGFALFEFQGGATAAFSIGDPTEPIGTDDNYIYRQTVDATSNNAPILKQSKVTFGLSRAWRIGPSPAAKNGSRIERLAPRVTKTNCREG